jgi:hypothetical protein
MKTVDGGWWYRMMFDTTNDDGQGKPSHTTSKQPATNINHLHLKNDNVVMFKPDCFIVQKDLGTIRQIQMYFIDKRSSLIFL